MSLLKELKTEFQPRQLLPSITAGVIVATIDVSMEISLAALIFSGSLSPFLGRGVGLMLFGVFVMGIVTALTASVPGLISCPQDTPVAILALVASGISAGMRLASPSAIYATVLAAISLTSLLMGLSFLLLGRLKASSFVRYIPYPVVGGFLVGTGWLLAKGAMGVMVSLPSTITDLPRLFALDTLIQWGPGVLFAVALVWILRRWNHYWITPVALILAISLFYGYLLLADIPVAEASARGWLLGKVAGAWLYQPLMPAAFAEINWHAILTESDQIASILVLSAVALLLNASGLEVTFKQDFDLNRELMTAGYLNLVGGIGGSPVGYQTLSMSTLAYRLGARTRLVNLIFSLLVGSVLIFGGSLLAYFPRFILGGLSFYLGLTFMVEWLVDARGSLPTIDYLLVWLILAIIVVFGFLQGIAAGVLIAAILFVISYSRVNIIRSVLTGGNFRSNVDRPQAHRRILAKHGGQIYVLRLQGFIFFGTVRSILDKVRSRLADKAQPGLGYLVLDFQLVTRLDSSAVFGITRLKQLTMANGIWMVWTQVSPEMQPQLRRGRLIDETHNSFIILPTLDHGMEWCENKILAEQGITDRTGNFERMHGLLQRAFPALQDVDRLSKYLERRNLAEGEYLMHEGDPESEMYFLEAGMVSVQLEAPDGKVVRLRSIRAGATVGEMGLYLGQARTASVVASRPSTVYRLSADALQKMRAEDPEVAALLHEWIARLLAERLTEHDRTIEALMD